MTPSLLSYPTVKRLLDAVAVLVLLGPAVLVLAVASVGALVAQGRPVLFTQRRVGRHGKSFLLLKLRTMNGRAYRERDRITRYGRLLRRLRIDELPQLLNVLAGSMSLVGPRPLLADHLALVGGGGRRHDVRPGLTCYAQLELAERGYLDKHRQVELDEAYVARLSLRGDLAILARTAGTWLRRHRDESDSRQGPRPPE